MPHEYERLDIFLLEEVFPFVPKEEGKMVIRKYAGKNISLGKKKLRIFATKGTTCLKCGIEGTFLALERHKTATRYHFNVYATNDVGNEVQLTLDHIIPKAKNGTNEECNLQPMCEPCNRCKADIVEKTCISNMQENLTKSIES